MTLIATVMGAPTKEDRTADATALLDYGFANFAPYTPDLSAALTPLRVRMGQKETVTLEAGEIQPVVVAKEEASNVTTETHLPDAVDAPIEAGQELGSVTVKSGDKTLLTIPLAAAEAVDRLRFGDVYQSFLRAALMKQAG